MNFDSTQTYFWDLFTYTSVTLPGSYTTNLSAVFDIITTNFKDSLGGAVDKNGFSVINLQNEDGSGKIQLAYAPVPEPSTYGLMLGGLALAAAAVRRRRAKK